MAHARKQIRDALKTLLTGLTTTGSRVYQNNVYSRETMPFMVVDIDGDAITNQDGITSGKRLQQRALDVRISVVAEGRNAMDQLDTSSVEIETAIASDTNLSGLVHDMMYLELNIEQDGNREKPIMRYEHNIQINYLVRENAPETLI